MVASDVVTTSAVVANGIAAAASHPLYPALVGFVGTLLGAGVAQTVAILIARANRRADSRKDALRRAFDSAGSHVAQVTFDKYVQFCEAYVHQWGEALALLHENGPCKEAMDHARSITQLRQQWMLWVPAELDDSLNKYEIALLEIGTNAMVVDRLDASSTRATDDLMHKMYKRFCEITGIGTEWNGEQLSDDLKILNLMQQLRLTLGTNDFNKLRIQTTRLALTDLNDFATT